MPGTGSDNAKETRAGQSLLGKVAFAPAHTQTCRLGRPGCRERPRTVPQQPVHRAAATRRAWPCTWPWAQHWHSAWLDGCGLWVPRWPWATSAGAGLRRSSTPKSAAAAQPGVSCTGPAQCRCEHRRRPRCLRLRESRRAAPGVTPRPRPLAAWRPRGNCAPQAAFPTPSCHPPAPQCSPTEPSAKQVLPWHPVSAQDSAPHRSQQGFWLSIRGPGGKGRVAQGSPGRSQHELPP